jgi:exoribonuclease II
MNRFIVSIYRRNTDQGVEQPEEKIEVVLTSSIGKLNKLDGRVELYMDTYWSFLIDPKRKIFSGFF